jgi:hypothetical protein
MVNPAHMSAASMLLNSVIYQKKELVESQLSTFYDVRKV